MSPPGRRRGSTNLGFRMQLMEGQEHCCLVSPLLTYAVPGIYLRRRGPCRHRQYLELFELLNN